MPVKVVIGAQWGDEGKGKITDYLAQKADLCIRVNGGDNAGHTVLVPEEFKLHLVPCGIFNPKTLCIIGNGVAVNPKNLIEEMDALESRGVSCENLRISTKAHLIMPWHLILDGLQEEERGEGKIGTTKRGIGPVFSDKVARFGFRTGDLLPHGAYLQNKLWELWKRANNILSKAYGYQGEDMVFGNIIKDFLYYSCRLFPYIKDTEPIIWEALDKDKRILLEGAQGLMLDPDYGTYPQTTSSLCTTNGALQGSSGVSWLDLARDKKREVIGVVKAYTTRVCEKNHPFRTEMPDEIANPFREKAEEFGATTGRPRRIGWLDAPLLKYAARINGFTSLAITRMDTLGMFLPVPVVKIWDGCKYLEMPGGWGSDVKSHTARSYLKMIENLVGVPIKYISYGPERDQIIVVRKWYSF